MNIFSGVMKLALLAVLLFLVENVFGDSDGIFQERAARAGPRKYGIRPFDGGNFGNRFLRPHTQNMQDDYNGDDNEVPEDGEGDVEENGEGDVEDNGEGDIEDNGEGDIEDNDEGDVEDNGEGDIEDNGEGDIEDNGEGDIEDNGEGGDYAGYVDKIVGGQEAARGEFPWQVSVEILVKRSGKVAKFFTCGAVIINEFWILSAAHCFLGRKASDFALSVGNHHLRRKDKGEQEFYVEKIISHERYNQDKDQMKNDIALLKIKPTANGQGIKFSKNIQPVRLPEAKTVFTEGTKCVISGWGKTHKDSPVVSEVLLKTDSPIVNQKKCKQAYGALLIPVHVSELSICSGNDKGGNGVCAGDSGGGLVCKTGNVYTLAGLVSGGIPCALPNYPAVFTLVPKFIPWIQKNIAG